MKFNLGLDNLGLDKLRRELPLPAPSELATPSQLAERARAPPLQGRTCSVLPQTHSHFPFPPTTDPDPNSDPDPDPDSDPDPDH